MEGDDVNILFIIKSYQILTSIDDFYLEEFLLSYLLEGECLIPSVLLHLLVHVLL